MKKNSIKTKVIATTLPYNHYTNTVMFSGEALDKAKPVCEYVTQVYSAGCATLVESLKVKEIGNYAREKGMTIRKLLNKKTALTPPTFPKTQTSSQNGHLTTATDSFLCSPYTTTRRHITTASASTPRAQPSRSSRLLTAAKTVGSGRNGTTR